MSMLEPQATSPAAAARAWRSALPPQNRKASTTRGVALVSAAFTAYLITFLGMYLAPHWSLRTACLIVQPVTIGMLFIIGHDAAHNTLTASGLLNRVLGRLVFLPPLHCFTSWAHAHNTNHHGWTNFKGREPAFPPFSKAEFDALPWWRRQLERLYRSAPGIGVFYLVDFYFKHILLPPRRHLPPFRVAFQLDRLLVLTFLALQLAAAYFLAGLQELPGNPALQAGVKVLGCWMAWLWFMGFVSYIQHTHPRMAWYDKEEEWSFYHVQMRSTAHVVFPWLVERLLHNIMDHPAHHLDPTIPLTALPGSQKQLERSAPEHAVVIRWTPLEFLRMTAACKLYDFDRHCWLDFAGRPTTPTGLAGLGVPQSRRPAAAAASAAP